MDEVGSAPASGGKDAAADTLVRLLTTDHLNDQRSALAWLKQQPFDQMPSPRWAIPSAGSKPFSAPAMAPIVPPSMLPVARKAGTRRQGCATHDGGGAKRRDRSSSFRPRTT